MTDCGDQEGGRGSERRQISIGREQSPPFSLSSSDDPFVGAIGLIGAVNAGEPQPAGEAPEHRVGQELHASSLAEARRKFNLSGRQHDGGMDGEDAGVAVGDLADGHEST